MNTVELKKLFETRVAQSKPVERVGPILMSKYMREGVGTKRLSLVSYGFKNIWDGVYSGGLVIKSFFKIWRRGF